MTDTSLLAPWIRRFLVEYMVTERNLARSTQLSYRDTLAGVIRYVANSTGKRPDLLKVEDLSRERIRQFFLYREQKKGCGSRTTNQRLAALHSFARFVGEYCPEQLQWSGSILCIPFKRFPQPQIPFLEKSEMDALLAEPNSQTPQGQRDHALLLFLYNTGARAAEVAEVRITDLQLPPTTNRGLGFVTLRGKGGKTRLCPLWSNTVRELRPLITGRTSDQQVFLNRCRQPITRFGIHALVERHAKRIATRLPVLKSKRVSPHTIRHTSASHLLRAGVDINTIRAWLGHVSINTTNVYAQIDLEMKARALAQLKPTGRMPSRKQRSADLMTFLQSL